jgi:hypothetical protein
VKVFTSLQQGAPVIANAWGDMVAALDACLVNGFNPLTIASITRTGPLATATITAGHLIKVDQVELISGCDQAEYNGEKRVISATATEFTFAIAETAAAAATGAAMSTKAAPLDFEIAFTGTNKRVYRSANVESNRPFLRVDNSLDAAYNTTYAKMAKVTMAENMTGIDTFGVGGRAPYDPSLPTKNETATGTGTAVMNGWFKWYQQRFYNGGDSSVADPTPATARQWVIIGDDRGFYFFIAPSTPGATGSTGMMGYCFMDFPSYKPADGFNTLLCASDRGAIAAITTWTADVGMRFGAQQVYDGKALMRDYTGVGEYVRAGFFSLNSTVTQMVGSGSAALVPFPNGPDFSLVLYPTYLREEGGNIRGGPMPGMYHIPQLVWSVYPNLCVLDTVTGYPGKKFMLIATANLGGYSEGKERIAFDIVGPWR